MLIMSELILKTAPNGFSDQVLANNIRYYRKKLGLKAQELADLVYISNGRQIYKWESGEARPGYESLFALSKVFGVSTDILLGYVNTSYDAVNLHSEYSVNAVA